MSQEQDPPREDPQAPGDPGPQSSGPRPPGPESPAGQPAPPAPAHPHYGGPTPPGGWQQPVQHQPGPLSTGYAVKRGVGRVLGFSVLSFGLYGFYWFYVTREQMTREVGGDDNAGLQTAGLLVPILNIFIIYWLWRDINIARTRVGLDEFSIPVYLVLSLLGLSPIFYCLVVSKLNEYWDRRTNGQATDAPVTGGEKAVVAVGLVLLVLYIVFILLIIILAAATSGAS